jgi:methylphosphotriester-DNA--protein-cysteine methyltransferase
MSYTTEAARWRALTCRDPLANGHFVYLVKSTNIYCRPTCPARLARRANVGFVETPAQAEAAGYRACKRCKPQEAINHDPQELAVSKACSLIEEAVTKNDVKSIRLQELAKNVGLTPRYFHKIFKVKQ